MGCGGVSASRGGEGAVWALAASPSSLSVGAPLTPALVSSHSPVKFSPFEAFKPVASGDSMELGPPQPPPPEGTAPLPIKPSGGAKKQKGGRGRVPR